MTTPEHPQSAGRGEGREGIEAFNDALARIETATVPDVADAVGRLRSALKISGIVGETLDSLLEPLDFVAGFAFIAVPFR